MASFLLSKDHLGSDEATHPKPKFDLGGAVSSHNLHKTDDDDQLYKSQPNLAFEESCDHRYNLLTLKQHRSLLDRPLVAVVMEPASALGLLDGSGGAVPKADMDSSPSTGFKSSFAKEVARGRKAAAAAKSLTRHRFEEQDEYSPPMTPPYFRQNRRATTSTLHKYRKSHQFQESSEADSMMTEEYISNKHVEDDEDGLTCRDLWMTSTQFSQLLDKQEAAETNKFEKNNNKSRVSAAAAAHQPPQNNVGKVFRRSSIASSSGSSSAFSRLNLATPDGSSFLDNDAKVPFFKLKQNCKDLGFSFTESEWTQLRQMLFSEQSNVLIIGNNDPSNSSGGGNEFVRNGDFFTALEMLMKDKHHQVGRDDHHHHHHRLHKYSMKSDSGGEMESCRSSDSELHDSTRGSGTSGSSPSPENLVLMAENWAEKETELLKVRLECQRLQEDNANLNNQLKMRKDRRVLDLEKEVDHLKWQLNAMETSRRTYEEATQRLVMFLETVTTVLQGSNPVQRKLMESTRAEISRVARRAKIQSKRLSLDSQSIISRTESMPGLNFGMNGSLLSLSTTTSNRGGVGVGSDVMSSVSSSSHKSGKTASGCGSFSSAKTMPVNSGPIRSSSSSKKKCSKVQRSQSTQGKLPSLKERDYVNAEIVNKYVSNENLGKKKHVCAIRIGGGEDPSSSRSISEPRKPLPQLIPLAQPVAAESKLDNTSRVLLNSDESTQKEPSENEIKPAVKPKQEIKQEVKKKSIEEGGKMQVLVASNSNKPTTKTEELPLQNQTKFKSLGDLHMEKGLPATPRHLSSEDGTSSSNDVVRDRLASNAQKLLRSMKQLLAREKTLTITPKKSSKSSFSTHGATDVVATSAGFGIPGATPLKVQKRDPDKPPNLQLLSTTSFPGLPSYPVLAASRSSPWNC